MSPLTGGTSGMGAAFARHHSEKALSRCTIPAGSKSTALPLRWMKKAPQRGDRDDRSGRIAVVRASAGLTGGLTALATFADGPILVAGGVHYWQVTRAGTVRRLPDTRGLSAAYEMAALPGQRFAASFGTNLYIVDAHTGHVQELSREIQDPIAASGDGAILTSAKRDGRWAIVRVAPDGTITPLTYAGPPEADPLGAGDGLALGALPAVPFTNRLDIHGYFGSFALAPDGTLLFADTSAGPRRRDGLRALSRPTASGRGSP
ncbi:MAG TPA: hypothetical protein VFY45_02335 [Baekduia sp.]|nr:hypothetical protein [Baekduia sp.]